MSNRGGSSSSNGRGNGAVMIPAASKKMVQNLKEIVNCPEHEIYAMLKECNMDPNDTVNRLLSQDPFHEVKSKREKKKEMKENTESRSRGVNGISNRSRVASDRDVRNSMSTAFSSNEYAIGRGKSAYKKDNGANPVPNSSSVSGITANNVDRGSAFLSNSISKENAVQKMGTSDGISLSSEPSSGFQPAWLGAPGHVTMADIVKMGRPHAKISTTPTSETAFVSNMLQLSVKHQPLSTPLLSDSHLDIHSSQDPASKDSDITHEPILAVNQDLSHGDWPLIEQSPAVSGPSVSEPAGASVIFADCSSTSLYVDRVNLHPSSEFDEVQATEGTVTVQNQMVDTIRSVATSDGQLQLDGSGIPSCFDDTSCKSSSYPQSPTLDHQEGKGGSSRLSISDCHEPSSVEDVGEEASAAAGLQSLSLWKEAISAPPGGESPAVIIPNHLQVPAAGCSHLSFGSFGSGSFVSKTLKSNSSEASTTVVGSSIEHLDSRNLECYGNEQQRFTSNETVESPSSSLAEVVKHDTAVEARHKHQYPFPSSAPDYAIEYTARVNAAGYSYSQTHSQMENPPSYSTAMQAPTDSLPGNLLASTVQPVRESDFPYSPFITTQPMPTKYSSGMPSISSSTMSMLEAMKPSVLPTPQPTPQTLPSTSIPMGPALPQHIPMHPYSQPTLFANMITYPFLPQSYSYMPSAFQQAYAANSVYHQSPATVQNTGVKYSIPQYKNSVSVSSLPQPAAIASGYGGFGSSTNIPGNFLLNPSTTPPSTTIGYEEVTGSQHRDSNHYGTQQNEASTMWVNGPGSRTMSALPGSTYYIFPGNNQHGSIRQSQQPSHYDYGASGYPNFYHSQTGVSQEHQPPRDGTVKASQGPPSQQCHQIWQHSY